MLSQITQRLIGCYTFLLLIETIGVLGGSAVLQFTQQDLSKSAAGQFAWCLGRGS